ncbi:MAG TPA: hypothetical protein VGD49_01090 [Longimicrobiales bacterium]
MWQRKLAISFVILSLGCTTLRPVEAPVPFLAMHRPNSVLITGPDGNEIELAGPRLQSDSIIGLYENEPFKIPLLEIKQLRAKQVDNKRTVMFAGAVALGAAAAITGIAIAKGNHNVPLDTNYKCPNQLCRPTVKSPQIKIRLPFLVPLR